MLEARAAVKTMHAYRPPLAGREGLRLDFNESTIGCSPRVLARLRTLDAESGGALRDTIKTHHKTLRTNLEGVYAAGDIVRGASLVVWAIRDGRDAAAAIHADLAARVPADEAAE